jgi:hypothetical protein
MNAGGRWLTAALLAASLSIAGRIVISAQGNGETQLNCGNTPCDAVARGRTAFNDRILAGLGGNGRACADCHVPSEQFQLSPAVARARFEALLAKREFNKNADDPLFRPVDADDFRENADRASDYSNLVENGLVRVTLPLPGRTMCRQSGRQSRVCRSWAPIPMAPIVKEDTSTMRGSGHSRNRHAAP